MPLNYGDPIDPYGVSATDPLAMRMMEHIPGISASIGFSSMRGANTLIRGGYMDDATRFASRRAKYGVFQNKALTTSSIGRSSFAFGSRRFASDAAAATSGKNMFLKPSRLNNVSARPRNLSRFHSLSVFTAAEGSGLYTYAQGHRLLNKLKLPGLREAAGVADDAALFGPGLFAAISAGTKLDRMTKAGRLTGGALDQLGLNIQRLATANNPALLGSHVPAALGMSSMYDDSMRALQAGGKNARGVAGNLMASSMQGAGTQYLAGYFRGAQGFANALGLEGRAAGGARTAVQHLAKALGDKGVAGRSGAKFIGEAGAKKLLEGSMLRQLTTRGLLNIATTSTGSRVLAARGVALAIPGLQILAGASLVYDLAKMGGEVIKSGINLARDANKSLQGSINKPMFGMGYRDTELAATSRSRGVMAIQNSRLNARSVLGSEASMMAAHFG